MQSKSGSNIKRFLSTLYGTSNLGLVLVILVLGAVLTRFGGTHLDQLTQRPVSNFFNSHVLLQLATDASFFAIMAVGMTAVIITAGIDLSVGAIYAVSGVATALVLKDLTDSHHMVGVSLILAAIIVSLLVGVICGFINGFAIVSLDTHPFIITLGTLWAFRGVAFVLSKGNSYAMPDPVIGFANAGLGLPGNLHPVPLLMIIVVMWIGAFILGKTPAGRAVYAIGGNLDASRYSGLPIKKIILWVYVFSGLCAGLAAFLGTGFYGSASSNDGSGYELYVIAAAVVGGTSLMGGKGNPIGAVLGAVLIAMIRQSIIVLHLDTNYEQIIDGVAIIVAVVIDRLSSEAQARRLLAQSQ